MASSEGVPTQVTAKLNDEQKAHLVQQMKEIETNNAHEQGKTEVTLRYFSDQIESAEFYSRRDWAGFARGYPQSLLNDGTPATFDHYANVHVPGAISKGAVAYSAGDHYWLVGWDGHRNKIYVDYAEKGPMDWPSIERALDASNRFSSVVYPGTNITAAMANINNGKASTAFYNFKV